MSLKKMYNTGPLISHLGFFWYPLHPAAFRKSKNLFPTARWCQVTAGRRRVITSKSLPVPNCVQVSNTVVAHDRWLLNSYRSVPLFRSYTASLFWVKRAPTILESVYTFRLLKFILVKESVVLTIDSSLNRSKMVDIIYDCDCVLLYHIKVHLEA